MTTGIAAAVSIVGVLAAGSVAALVNTQVFDGTPNESGASAAVLPPPSTVEVSIPAATVPPSTLVTVTTATPTSTTLAPVDRPTGMLTRFDVGDAGSVTVDVIEGRLVFVDVEALPGWTIVEQDDDSDGIEVVFESATVRVEFEAQLIGGEIVPTVESESLSAPSASPSAASPAPPPPAPAVPVTAPAYEDDEYEDDEYEDDGYDEYEKPEEEEEEHGDDDRDD